MLVQRLDGLTELVAGGPASARFRGPDSEPLVADGVPVALLAPAVRQEAVREDLDTGRPPDGP